MTSHAVRRLATRITGSAVKSVQAAPTARGADWRTATVATVGTDGTITTTDGIPCRRADTYLLPVVGDRCIITRSGNGNWLAIARTVGASSGIGVYTNYTPTVTGGGTAVWTGHAGWYLQQAPGLVFFTAFATNSTAGNGTATVSVTGPFPIYRTTRQVVTAHLDTGVAASTLNLTAIALGSGSGAVWDRLRKPDGTNLTGADIAANATLTVEGWYRTT